jgi:hypothetical protein
MAAIDIRGSCCCGLGLHLPGLFGFASWLAHSPRATLYGPVSVLAKGRHRLTAVFTPTDPTKFKPSTSNTVTFTFENKAAVPRTQLHA